jgi:fatty-acyl-CoA synthase
MSIGAATLPAALLATASDGRGELVFHLDEGEQRLTTGELAERAHARAQHLVRLGVRPGDPVGLLGSNHPLWAEWAFATWMAGAVVVPIAHPLRLRSPSIAAEHMLAVTRSMGCRLVVGEPSMLPPLPDVKTVSWDEPPDRGAASLPTVEAGDLALIQSTSGSTAAPKGVMVTHAAVVAERRATAIALALEATDVVVGWLPFFYGGGLCSFLLFPTMFGISGHVLPTTRFARDPAGWLRVVAGAGGTIIATPPTALAVAVQAAARQPDGVDLSSVRAAGMGAEGIDPGLIDTLLDRAGRFGLRSEAAISFYGLEEAVCVATATQLGAGIGSDTVDLDDLAASGRATPATGGNSKRIASCGRPVGGLEVQVRSDSGEVPERSVGEVMLRGPSLMSGYRGTDAPDAFVDGWMHTGDLGYVADGQLYITGRSKDVVFVYGRNYYPEDFEWAAERVPGVRSGRCVAFSDPDADGMVTVLVEPGTGADAQKLPAAVRNAIADSVGIVPTRVLVVEPGTVAKTDSGKLRRGLMRDAFLRGELSALANGD